MSERSNLSGERERPSGGRSKTDDTPWVVKELLQEVSLETIGEAEKKNLLLQDEKGQMGTQKSNSSLLLLPTHRHDKPLIELDAISKKHIYIYI